MCQFMEQCKLDNQKAQIILDKIKKLAHVLYDHRCAQGTEHYYATIVAGKDRCTMYFFCKKHHCNFHLRTETENLYSIVEN